MTSGHSNFCPLSLRTFRRPTPICGYLYSESHATCPKLIYQTYLNVNLYNNCLVVYYSLPTYTNSTAYTDCRIHTVICDMKSVRSDKWQVAWDYLHGICQGLHMVLQAATNPSWLERNYKKKKKAKCCSLQSDMCVSILAMCGSIIIYNSSYHIWAERRTSDKGSTVAWKGIFLQFNNDWSLSVEYN